MADPNAGLEATVADTLDALGQHERAAMIRANLSATAEPQLLINSLEQDNETLSKILNDVPDSPLKPASHSSECWKRHAACLRDKIWRDLGWE